MLRQVKMTLNDVTGLQVKVTDPSHNSTAEYIGETNRSLKEGVSDHQNQTTNAIRNHHISTKHPKSELKDCTLIDRESNTLHY